MIKWNVYNNGGKKFSSDVTLGVMASKKKKSVKTWLFQVLKVLQASFGIFDNFKVNLIVHRKENRHFISFIGEISDAQWLHGNLADGLKTKEVQGLKISQKCIYHQSYLS